MSLMLSSSRTLIMSRFKHTALRLLEPLTYTALAPDQVSWSEFELRGEFLGLIYKDQGTPKYLRLGTERGVAVVKLTKDLRSQVETLQIGDRIQVRGERKVKLKRLEIKLKATDIALLDSKNPSASKPESPPTSCVPREGCRPERILVCQKSDCCQRGARQVIAALEDAIAAKGLENQVTIVKTGCVKNCKAGPNLTIASDKTRYSRIRAQDIPKLLDQRFGS